MEFKNSENTAAFKSSMRGIRIFALLISTVTSAVCLALIFYGFSSAYVASGGFMGFLCAVAALLLCFWIDFKWVTPMGRYALSETTARGSGFGLSGLRWIHLVGAWLMFVAGVAVSGTTTFLGVKMAFAFLPDSATVSAAGEVAQLEERKNKELAPYASRVNELEAERDRMIQEQLGHKVLAGWKQRQAWYVKTYGEQIRPIEAAYKTEIDSARTNLQRERNRLQELYGKLQSGAIKRDELAALALETRSNAGQNMLGIVGVICLGVGVICLWMEGASDVRNVLDKAYAKADANNQPPTTPADKPAEKPAEKPSEKNNQGSTKKPSPF